MHHSYTQKQTILAFLFVAFQSIFAFGMPAADDLSERLSAFDAQPSATAANAIFAVLQRQGLTEKPIRFTNATPVDTLRQQVWYWMAEHYYDAQDYTAAATQAERAFPLCVKGRNRTIEADCANLLAVTYVRLADYEKAARYARHCYELDRKEGDADKMSSSLNTLAAIYMSARQPQQAVRYIEEGLRQSDKTDNLPRRAVIEGMASEVYIALGDSQQALNHARKAYQIEQRLGRKDKMAVRLTQMAVAFSGVNQEAKALDALRQAIPQLQADGNDHSLALAFLTLGRVQSKTGQRADAIASLRKASNIFARQGDLYNESHACLMLYEILKDSLPQEAMACQEHYRILQDSIYDREVAQSLAHNALPSDAIKGERSNYLWVNLLVALLLALICVALFFYMRSLNRRQVRLNDKLSGVMDELRTENRQLREMQRTVAATQAEGNASESDRQFLSDVEAHINDLLNDSQTVSAQVLAQKTGLSQYQLRQRITETTGASLNTFIQKARMHRARRLLLTRKDLTVMEVALLCNYSDQSNFTRTFKHVFGITPTQLNELHKKQQ